MKYDLSSFQDNLKELHIVLSDHQMEQFITYYEMLVETNKVMNLTSITEFDEVIKKHFVDSLCLVKAFDNGAAYFDENRKVIDIGTGAGFPGIPLKIAFPKLEITLLCSWMVSRQFMEGRRILPSRRCFVKSLIFVFHVPLQICRRFQNTVFPMSKWVENLFLTNRKNWTKN